MSISTNASAAAIAAALLASPALAADAQTEGQAGINEGQDAAQEFDQRYGPGDNQSPKADVRGKGPPSVAEEEQQANRLPDEPQLAAIDGGWAERGAVLQSAGEAVDFWRNKVDHVDPETVRLDELKARLDDLETQHDRLEATQSGTWERDRDAFQAVLLALREQYVELPAARKSDPVTKEPGDGYAPDVATD